MPPKGWAGAGVGIGMLGGGGFPEMKIKVTTFHFMAFDGFSHIRDSQVFIRRNLCFLGPRPCESGQQLRLQRFSNFPKNKNDLFFS